MKCVVVGAGPVGALAALYAARRGWDVEVYDLRGDLRDASTTPLNFSRSINLALSERGINALRHSDFPGLLDAVLTETIPMYGRMIHGQDSSGSLRERDQIYDVHGRFLYAIDRGGLNRTLLDALTTFPNVKLNFYHKLTGADFRKRKAWFERRTAENVRIDEIEVNFDLVLGCDGAHSRVRYHLNKFVRLNHSQYYIDTIWCEFTIPPASSSTGKSATTSSAKDGFATSPNHLHIWPSKDMMFIAIPSMNKSFTCTFFAPSAVFSKLEQAPQTVELFFNQHFPGAVDLIGPSEIQEQFVNNPHLPLISVKCSPHHFLSSGVILGDAAHAMVPFYGQGMNSGLEDVRVLFEHLDSTLPRAAAAVVSGNKDGNDDEDTARGAALEAYTRQRVPDSHVISDFAMANYWEMHSGVSSRTRLFRKRVEEFLADKFPRSGFETQYSRVSFSNQRYSEVQAAVARQDHVLALGLAGSVATPILGAMLWCAWRFTSLHDGGFSKLTRGFGTVLDRLQRLAIGAFRG